MKRPNELPEKEHKEFFSGLADEIIKNKWDSYCCKEDIISDLEDLSMSDSGFEKAKELDDTCNYDDISVEFIEWLDDIEYRYIKKVETLVKEWVQEKSIEPKLELGDCLVIKENVFYDKKFQVGTEIYVNKIFEDTAKYGVWTEKSSQRNLIVSFEKLEGACEIKTTVQ